MSGERKQIAWFFIMLLAGHEVAEATRMNKQRRSRAAGAETKAFQHVNPIQYGRRDGKVEDEWQAENGLCGSNWLFQCKKGPKNPNDESVRRCAYQPLAGDILTSSKCRVTDEWMLNGTPEKPPSWWLTMQVKLLKAKSAKLVASCGANNPNRNEKKCARRMQHILRSLRFIGKASKTEAFGELIPEQVNEAQDAANVARDQIAQVVFASPEKRSQLNRLAEALKKDQQGLQQNPKATITKALKVLQDDILPDDVDPTDADKKIQQMELEAKPADPEDEAALNARVKELQADVANAPSDLDDTFDNAIQEMENEVVVDEEEVLGNGTNSSLMQRREGDTVVQVLGFVAVVILMVLAIKFVAAVVWGTIVFWIFASIFGCTVAAIAPEDSVLHRAKRLATLQKGFKGASEVKPDPRAPQKSNLRLWGGCVVKWISMPFVLSFKFVRLLGSKFGWWKRGWKSSLIDAGHRALHPHVQELPSPN